jgi:peptide/nickel transport system substrate-binding protein
MVDEDHSEDSGRLTRRQLIAAAASSSLAGIAGCLGGDDDTDTPTSGNGNGGNGNGGNGNGGNGMGTGTDGGNGNGGGDTDTDTGTPVMVDQTYVNAIGENVRQLQGNPWNSTTYDASTLPQYWNMRYYNYNSVNAEYLPGILEDASVDGSTMTLQVSDQYEWHNGDAVTADDVVTHMRMARLMDTDPLLLARASPSDILSSVDEITAPDETTVEAQLTGELNPSITLLQAFGAETFPGTLTVPDAVYGSFVQDFQDAGSDEARNQVRTNVREFVWSFDEAYGCGIMQIDEIQEGQIRMSTYEGHPESDAINWTGGVELRELPQTSGVIAARNNIVDVTGLGGVDPTITNTFPEGWQDVSTIGNGGVGLVPNWDDEIFGQLDVRRAFAHILDTNEISNALQGFNSAYPDPPTYVFNQQQQEFWMGDPIEGNLITYNSDEEAANLLESAGFSQEGGTWYKPDDMGGDQFTPTIDMWGGLDKWVSATRTFIGQLERFGIEAELVIHDRSVFFPEYEKEDMAYSCPVEFHAHGGPQPLLGLTRNLTGYGGGNTGYAVEQTVPEVGSLDNDEVTYNVNDLAQQAREATNEDDFVQAVRTLAWVQNLTVPTMPFTDFQQGRAFNNGDWNHPTNENNFWEYEKASGEAMNQGMLTAKTN